MGHLFYTVCLCVACPALRALPYLAEPGTKPTTSKHGNPLPPAPQHTALGFHTQGLA